MLAGLSNGIYFYKVNLNQWSVIVKSTENVITEVIEI